MAGVQRTESGPAFIYDTGVPTADFTDPNAADERSLPEIFGTANPTGGVLSTVQSAIQKDPGGVGFYWNPTNQDFDIADLDSAWMTVTQDPDFLSWKLTGASTPTWVVAETYRVFTRATDQAGNTSNPVNYTFIFDNTPPTLGLNHPVETPV